MAIKEILVVDDEVGIRELLSEILLDEGYDVHVAESAIEARTFRNQQAPDLVLLDIWMPDTDGITLLKEWGTQGLLTMPVIMMSGHGTIETALEATRIGATDFLEKPIALQKLLAAVTKAIQQKIVPPTSDRAVGVSTLVSQGVSLTASQEAETSLSLSLDLPLREARENFDSLYFNYHMDKEGGNVARVAKNAGLERTHLYRKLKQLDIRFAKKDEGAS
ncbi:MAG: response regulator [Candidatus Nitrotoga sp.]|jgi:DNA-binding NtrC family response regulator|nr:response regulator [Candidatus Nitrotoga sp.]MDW7604096.1 response regulator [Candidatus Nitrotoga sp.]MDW7612815.1 response regulator [Candidatus Nitrotoga sp.]MDW7625812.1 response regulator [Candidatus Nitrotoga sp.]